MEKNITICIPVFNGEKTISFAIESCLKFNYPELEILISDNASEDNTKKIVLEYEDKFPAQIKYVLNHKNLGFAGNYKKCLKEASGKYIFFIGADDYLNCDGIPPLLCRLENNPEEAIVTSDINVFYKDPTQPTKQFVHFGSKERVFIRGDEALSDWLLNSVLGSIGGYLIRRAVLFEFIELIPDNTIVPQVYLGAYIACKHDVSHIPIISFSQKLSNDDSQLANKEYLSVNIIKEMIFLIENLLALYKCEFKNERYVRSALMTRYINGLIDNIISYRCYASFKVFSHVVLIIIKNNKKSLFYPKFIIYIVVSVLIPKSGLKKLLLLYRNKNHKSIIKQIFRVK
ncbi:MAG: hypothetical protein A2231_04065 [Candidatus Firestonebacteria bacterium RIFOXYA2_FULL_40_8]|nr:MAG: hypothetical protein A2231_04065 [Candidatus Firestonebacteria bacterium RIFOXYA2_FULL_40_8]